MNMNSSVISWRAWVVCFLVSLAPLAPAAAETNSVPNWISRPLALTDALNVALQQNSGLQKAKADLEAAYGVVIQTRAVALPAIGVTGRYTKTERQDIESFPGGGGGTNSPGTNGGGGFAQFNQSWNTRVQITQSIYEGGRIRSALRSAKLTQQQAVLNYQSAVADTLLAVRVAYYDTLVAEQEIIVNEASVNLLTKELEDQQHRFEAGTVPKFNVLRAEVAVANARPALIRARNAYRIGKNNLVNLLGIELPRDVWENVPLQLADKLAAEPYSVELPAAVSQALARRTELAALQKGEALQREGIVTAKAGYKPSVQAFAGYEVHNRLFATTDPSDTLHGWLIGGQLSWNIFSGAETQGKIIQARALYERSKADVDDRARQIELEVRTAYSSFIEAKEVLESQEKVQEQADEALRLARARAEAGTGTQLDVLDAETSLTQARTTQVQALHDYAVARAKLERAIGQDVEVSSKR